MAIPLGFSSARIVSSVRFSQDYSHIRFFNNKSSQKEFMDSRTTIWSGENLTLVKFNNVDGELLVDRHIEFLRGASYIIFENSEMTYYAFVTDLIFENNSNTRVQFTLDVFQTYWFNCTMLSSLVERAHVPRFTAGVPNLHTLEEGLNYGDAYDIKSVMRVNPYDPVRFLVIACTEPFHEVGDDKPYPTYNGVPQQMTYYVHPFLKTGGQAPGVNVSGATIENVGSALDLMNALANTQGMVGKVVSISVCDYIGLNVTVNGSQIAFNSTEIENVYFMLNGEEGVEQMQTFYVKNVPTYTDTIVGLGDKYTSLGDFSESKLYHYPYTVFQLTDLKGQTVDIHPDKIVGNNVSIRVRGSLGALQKTSYEVVNYNTGSISVAKEFSEYMQGIISDTPNLLPVVNDYAAAFIQGNANSIQQQYNAAAFAGTMAGASTGANMAGSVGERNVLGSVSNLVDGVSSVGSAVLQAQGITAKLKDIQNTPSNISAQGSNPNFDFGNDMTGAFLIKKQIKPEYRYMIQDYFHMYGYKVSRIYHTVPLKTRTHFNYVKLVEANIIGAMPRVYIERIKRIFENGVTLWHTDDMLNYNVSNSEV